MSCYHKKCLRLDRTLITVRKRGRCRIVWLDFWSNATKTKLWKFFVTRQKIIKNWLCRVFGEKWTWHLEFSLVAQTESQLAITLTTYCTFNASWPLILKFRKWQLSISKFLKGTVANCRSLQRWSNKKDKYLERNAQSQGPHCFQLCFAKTGQTAE